MTPVTKGNWRPGKNGVSLWYVCLSVVLVAFDYG